MFSKKFFVFLLINLVILCELDVWCRRIGGFGRSGISRARKPVTYRNRYEQKRRKNEYGSDTRLTKPLQPSAPQQPVANQRPVGWAYDGAQVKNTNPIHSQPKQIDNTNQKPIGWNTGNNPQANPIQPHPQNPINNQPPPPYQSINGQQIAPGSNVGQYGQQPHNVYPNNFGNGAGGHPPPVYQPNPYGGYNGFQTGGFGPQYPAKKSSGIGGILGSGYLGNALTGLTLWQLLRSGNRQGSTQNIYNNYYNNNGTVPIDNTVSSDQNFPIKERFENGTILLQDDTKIFPNGTLVLNNGTMFNTVQSTPANVTTAP